MVSSADAATRWNGEELAWFEDGLLVARWGGVGLGAANQDAPRVGHEAQGLAACAAARAGKDGQVTGGQNLRSDSAMKGKLVRFRLRRRYMHTDGWLSVLWLCQRCPPHFWAGRRRRLDGPCCCALKQAGAHSVPRAGVAVTVVVQAGLT